MNDREGTGRPSRPKARPTSESALRRLQLRGERLLHWVPDIRKTLLREGEPGVESLLGQVQSLGGQVSRRAQETGRDIEARAERLLADIEKQAVRGLKPLLARANVASHAEVETLERRLAHLEGRLGPLLDDRARLSTRVLELERTLEEARADFSERSREVNVRLAATDDVRAALAGIRNHLDTLSKDQVTRGLDVGKLHDRIVRLEMRFGDLLKDQGPLLADHEDLKKRLGAVDQKLEESARRLRAAVDQAGGSATTAREAADRLASIAAAGAGDRPELGDLASRLGDFERAIRQVDLRLGDLTERHAAAREELAGLAARIRQLEGSPTRPAAAQVAAPQSEGH